jgi:hypothetical protein
MPWRLSRVMPFTVELHKHLVEVPLPAAGFLPLDPPLPELRSEHRAKAMPPISDCLVADVDAAFVEQILHVAERQRETNVQHHCQADYLRAGLEVLEEGVLFVMLGC